MSELSSSSSSMLGMCLFCLVIVLGIVFVPALTSEEWKHLVCIGQQFISLKDTIVTC